MIGGNYVTAPITLIYSAAFNAVWDCKSSVETPCSDKSTLFAYGNWIVAHRIGLP